MAAGGVRPLACGRWRAAATGPPPERLDLDQPVRTIRRETVPTE
jgi:hypothetical protein